MCCFGWIGRRQKAILQKSLLDAAQSCVRLAGHVNFLVAYCELIRIPAFFRNKGSFLINYIFDMQHC